MSFVERQIDVTITLGGGRYGETVEDTVTLKGYRVSCAIANYGGDAMGELHCRIYGMPLSLINRLTTIGTVRNQMAFQNTIQIHAGDAGKTLATIYTGSIQRAWGSFQGAPDVALNVLAYAGARESRKPVTPNSYKGSVDAATIMKDLADQAGYSFENNGVSVILSNPYYKNTVLQQIRAVARAAHIHFHIENGTLSIWPNDGYRKIAVPKIGPGNGLVGYPSFSSQGLILRSEFLREARIGGRITVENSQLSMVNGTWQMYQVNHNIAAQMPNGPWFTEMGVFAHAE